MLYRQQAVWDSINARVAEGNAYLFRLCEALGAVADAPQAGRDLPPLGPLVLRDLLTLRELRETGSADDPFANAPDAWD